MTFVSSAVGGRVRALVWLVFIAIPLLQAIGSHDSGLGKALTIIATTVFVGVFIALAFTSRRPLPSVAAVAVTALLLGISITLTLAERANWASLFIFTAAAAAIALRRRLAGPAVAVCVAACALTTAAAGGPVGEVLGWSAPTAGVDMLMLVLADLRIRNRSCPRPGRSWRAWPWPRNANGSRATCTISSATPCR